MNKLKQSIGLDEHAGAKDNRQQLISYINLKLSSLDLPTYEKGETKELVIALDLIKNIREKNRILHDYLCPADKRIQDFLNRYLKKVCPEGVPLLPNNTFILDRYGLARELSLPADGNHFMANGIESFRIKQGVLHNPKNDRRTTKGAFHIAAGGFPVAADKLEVPGITYGKLLAQALNPPKEQMELPFTSTQEKKAATFVSLLLRPLVSPEVPGFLNRKDMEIRFFAPGNYVCNLDFVESIFSNAGDPYLPDNDAGLDPEHWTGYTGCIILAPHICGLNKKELGLPHVSEATERQKRDGMCWTEESELYNNGNPFKLTARDESGVMVTLIADNYFGYCKKEVKTQIGFAANLYGLCEEEHAGGALAIPRINLGQQFSPDSTLSNFDHTMDDVVRVMGDSITLHEEGYATDNANPNLFYIPETACFDQTQQRVSWNQKGDKRSLKLLPQRTFIYPSGYHIRSEKNLTSNSWRLVGTVAEGTLCHKPCTVSGGGKSEISKSISDAMLTGSIFVANYETDMAAVKAVIDYDYSTRFLVPREEGHISRAILTSQRSLGSVIKLLNPSPENTPEYNQWLEQIPNRIKGLVFLLKRHYNKSWGDDWKQHFSVDFINGELGHELKFEGRKMTGSYLRVGMSPEGIWRTSKLRTDFIPSAKIQWEDDISASLVVPTRRLSNLNPAYAATESVKIVQNCEYRFFQRPDEAVVRGFDKQAEADLASPNSFISNFAPLSRDDARDIMERSVEYDQYTAPMQELIRQVAASEDPNTYFVDSASPRMVNGAPSKNPRYLQVRPDLVNGEPKYLSETSMRLVRKIPAGQPLFTPVNAVLPGRRNNPAEEGIRPLAVFGPIHYQELPELFMEFICSLTGKSPSTTGAGTEGALTKGPFNALVPCADLNNALLAFILTGCNGFSTAAGYIGSKYKVEHDVSLLIPELWCRIPEAERNPRRMIKNGLLEKMEDFDHNGQKVLGSRLGYRITEVFVNEYIGKIFEAPKTVFERDMLRPELQNIEEFVDGINNITETQQRIARQYLDDGSVNGFIPPLKALIHIMATGDYEGNTIESPAIRSLFTRESVLSSDWYIERLKIKQRRKASCCRTHIDYLKEFISKKHNTKEVAQLGIQDRLQAVIERLAYVETDAFINDHIGTIGADPIA
jgi:phosphoenolpyruvate carboxykinase (diphosphate)